MAQATPSKHKQVIERYLEAFNEQDVDALPELVTEDVLVQGLIGADGDVNGIEEYGEWWTETLSGIPDAHIELEDYFESGEKVAARWTFTGTQENDLFDIPATNRSFEITGLAIFRMEDEKIAEKRYQQDDLGMLQQLGIVEEH
ncbi:ester cyclase [Natronorubrum aibiense]|uniref:Ester cyclase n=1 Tax=Natronorubrum aibiense TaxID=348826 RepID=A0A5P9P051_9EURY|nr:ester cyclase [Natronorubrum aibiense]QFU81519.1 ester cyclase [Natronorubrum aibiense]